MQGRRSDTKDTAATVTDLRGWGCHLLSSSTGTAQTRRASACSRSARTSRWAIAGAGSMAQTLEETSRARRSSPTQLTPGHSLSSHQPPSRRSSGTSSFRTSSRTTGVTSGSPRSPVKSTTAHCGTDLAENNPFGLSDRRMRINTLTIRNAVSMLLGVHRNAFIFISHQTTHYDHFLQAQGNPPGGVSEDVNASSSLSKKSPCVLWLISIN